MSWRPRVLLVAPTPTLAKDLVTWLSDGGYEVVILASFGPAKVQLQSSPDLLISEIRLSEYNGLHLASRALARSIPAIVVGDADPVLERDAREMGCAYVHYDVDRQFLLMMAEHLTADAPSGGDARPVRNRPAAGHLAFVSSGDLPPRVSPRRGRKLN